MLLISYFRLFRSTGVFAVQIAGSAFLLPHTGNNSKRKTAHYL